MVLEAGFGLGTDNGLLSRGQHGQCRTDQFEVALSESEKGLSESHLSLVGCGGFSPPWTLHYTPS